MSSSVTTSAHSLQFCHAPHFPFSFFPAAVMAEIIDGYQYAVKAAIVDHQFSDPALATHLVAAHVQPVRVPQLVPPQGCVNLTLLPPGTEATMQVSRSQPF
jgi:hypothetical protein